MLGAPCWLTMTELLVDQWCLYVFESLPQTNPNTSLLWIIFPHYFRLSLGDNKHYINWEKESFLLLLLTLHFGFNAHSGYVDCPCCYSSLILDFLSNLFQQSVLIYLVYQYNYIFCLTVICSRQSTSPATSRCPYLICPNCCSCVIPCSEIKSLTLASTPSSMWPWQSLVFSSTTGPFLSYGWFGLYFFFPEWTLYFLYPCPRVLYLSDRIYLFLTSNTNLFKIQAFFKAIPSATSSFGLLLENLLPSFTLVVCLLLPFTILYTLSQGWYLNHISQYF